MGALTDLWRLLRFVAHPTGTTKKQAPKAHFWLLLGASKSNSLSLQGVSSNAELSRAKTATPFDLLRRCFALQYLANTNGTGDA